MKSRIMIVLLGSALLSGCATFDKFHIWYYENFKDVPVVVVDPVPVPDPKPDTPSPNPEAMDALPYNTIKWIGQANGSGAQITKALRSVTVKGDNVYIDWDGNADWNPVHHSDWEAGVDCYGRMCCFVVRGGQLIGGHVDHMRRECTQRDLNNVYGQYIFSPVVSPDEELYFVFLSNDLKNRTVMMKGVRK